MRPGIIVAFFLLGTASSALADITISVGIGLPSASVGINFESYPDLVPVPGYPVYYAPQLGSNLFFYDGLYWLYANDQWYSSDWYNGPWDSIPADAVPAFVLRVPVRYYRRPPSYFAGWAFESAPRWGEHWGQDWARRRAGWDQWNRSEAHAPAPLPSYQRTYSGNRYPRAEQQRALRVQNYRFQPSEPATRQRFAAPSRAPAATPVRRGDSSRDVPAPAAHPDVSRSAPAPVTGQRAPGPRSGPAPSTREPSADRRANPPGKERTDIGVPGSRPPTASPSPVRGEQRSSQSPPPPRDVREPAVRPAAEARQRPAEMPRPSPQERRDVPPAKGKGDERKREPDPARDR